MAQTTVAAPNHSNYNNLPNEGIIYIQRKLIMMVVDRADNLLSF